MILSELGPLVIAVFDRELERQMLPQHQSRILNFFYRWYCQERLYSILLPDTLLRTTETVFGDEILRDFILNMTRQIAIYLSPEESTTLMKNKPELPAYIQQLVVGLSQEDVAVDAPCLVPKQLHSQMALDAGYCESILVHNDWLVVLLILYLFFHQSTWYRTDGIPSEPEGLTPPPTP